MSDCNDKESSRGDTEIFEIEVSNEPRYIDKPNTFINAIYKGSVLADKFINQIFYEPGRAVQSDAGLEFSWTSEEIQHYFGMSSKNGSFYTRLKEAAHELTSLKFGYYDNEKNEFAIYNFITLAKLKDGTFTLCVNGDIRATKLFDKKNGGYTRLDVGIQKYKGQYTNKLYQVLRQYCYGDRNQKIEGGVLYKIKFGIYELRCYLGFIDMSDPAVSQILDRCNRTESAGTGPNEADYEAAYNAYKGKKVHERIDSFKARVIKTAVEEMRNKPCDIDIVNVEYLPRRGKVTHVEFTVKKKTEVSGKRNFESGLTGTNFSMDEDGQYEFGNDFEVGAQGTRADEQIALLFPKFAKYFDFSGDKLSKVKWLKGEIYGILKAADFKEELVLEKIGLLEQRTDIDDKLGWVAWAVIHDFDGKTTIEQRDNKKKDNEQTEDSMPQAYIKEEETGTLADGDDDGFFPEPSPEEIQYELEQEEERERLMRGNPRPDIGYLPNGNLLLHPKDGGKDIELPPEDARDSFARISSSMAEAVEKHFGMENTNLSFTDPYIIAMRLGMLDENDNFPTGENAEKILDFFTEAYLLAKGEDDIMEYAIRKTDMTGFNLYPDNYMRSRAYMSAVKNTIKEVVDYAFDSI